jgi:hypothetical protein
MWRELAEERGLSMAPPATPADIASAEAVVGCAFPAPLRELLQVTDGLRDEYGGEVVFGVQEIARHNHEMRTFADFPELYMPFDCLLFFGSEGNGDLYGFRVLSGGADDLFVFMWDHESDSRSAVAFGLAKYVSGDLWNGQD